MTASFRVATAGALMGEKLSIRVLNQNAGSFRLREVGVTKKQHALLQDAIKMPSGMILMCGPTGSGKTTTLYALLNEIDRSTRNVITVEDPIEAMLPNASQIEVNPKADITFAKVLRSILRQDPDVICVGEIRDEETAEIALRAAQTGHLVLATIHCDSNAAAIVRLLDLGVTPNLMATGLSLPLSHVYGVVTFYSFFTMTPRGKHQVRVCLGTACHVRGGHKVIEGLEGELGIRPGQCSGDRRFSLDIVRCLGCCALAPVMVVDDDIHRQVKAAKLKEIVRPYR